LMGFRLLVILHLVIRRCIVVFIVPLRINVLHIHILLSVIARLCIGCIGLALLWWCLRWLFVRTLASILWLLVVCVCVRVSLSASLIAGILTVVTNISVYLHIFIINVVIWIILSRVVTLRVVIHVWAGRCSWLLLSSK